jgi:hypothetical protein
MSTVVARLASPAPPASVSVATSSRRSLSVAPLIAEMLYSADSCQLAFHVAPNPRLQRTPSALPPSPLSRKALGHQVSTVA